MQASFCASELGIPLDRTQRTEPMTSRPRFQDVTETTGGTLTREAADMLYTRYASAARAATDRRVLELGCGAGLGLGLIARQARLVVGGDYSAALLASGRAHYGTRVPLVRLSAQNLPFADRCFDLVVCFEASYYFPDTERAFDEIRRVLAPGGEVRFANANPERPDFIPSPFSVHYHTADQFRTALSRRGFAVTIEGGFPVRPSATSFGRIPSALLPVARKVLFRLGLVPGTLRGRARLKRLIYWKQRSIPPELIPGFAREIPPEPLPPGPVRDYKVLYVRGRLG